MQKLLGLRPKPHWGALNAPQTPSCNTSYVRIYIFNKIVCKDNLTNFKKVYNITPYMSRGYLNVIYENKPLIRAVTFELFIHNFNPFPFNTLINNYTGNK